MSEVNDYRLGELVVSHNAARRPIKASDRVAGTTPYYGASGVVDWVEGFTHEGEFLLISEDGENLRSRTTPIAFNASGRIWVNNHAHVVTGRETFDTRFLGYALSITDITGYLSGSAQPKLTKAALDSIRLTLPPARERAAIVDVVGALDDKISANDKLGSVVDDLLSTRFAQMSMGANMTSLRSLAAVNRETMKPPAAGKLRYLDISSVGRGSYDLPPESEWASAPSRARRVISRGDVVWSTVRPNRRSHALVLDHEELIGSTGLAVITPHPGRTATVYEAARTDRFVAFLEAVAEGSAYPAVRADRFLDAPIPELEPNNLDRFEELALPLRELVHALTVESRQLAQTRDELLPHLISGRVRVQDAEQLVEGVNDAK